MRRSSPRPKASSRCSVSARPRAAGRTRPGRTEAVPARFPGGIFTDESTSARSTPSAKAYRDIVRGFYVSSTTRPILSPSRRMKPG